jgi:hypothetical protein
MSDHVNRQNKVSVAAMNKPSDESKTKVAKGIVQQEVPMAAADKAAGYETASSGLQKSSDESYEIITKKDDDSESKAQDEIHDKADSEEEPEEESEEEYDSEDDEDYDSEDDEEGEFFRFMLLPQEVRDMIWEYAMPEPRCLEVITDDLRMYASDDEDEDSDDDGDDDDGDSDISEGDRYYPPDIEDRPPEILSDPIDWEMPLAAVCRESRKAIEYFGYELFFERYYYRHGPWFCKGRDTVWNFFPQWLDCYNRGQYYERSKR